MNWQCSPEDKWISILAAFTTVVVAVDSFGEWVPAEVRAEPLYDPAGQRVRA